jgi:two-component system, cell cycle response regulator
MAQTQLERVISCPKLPSLPAVALEVVELTRDPNVSILRIAATIQNDPALTAKVLKTINSAYYALSQPCPSIARACSMLGLNAVKAIVLGFSLVDTTKALQSDSRFDLESYWRRAVFGAAGARVLATATRACDPEAAFVGAMLQDIGILAAFTALREEYADVLEAGAADHDNLAAIEKEKLGFDHAMAGKLMAERWKLPPQLVECVGCHHDPEKCVPAHEKLVRIVHLSTLISGALTVADSQKKLGQLIVKGRAWFGIDPAQARELVRQTSIGAAELGKVLELSTGQKPDAAAILREAHEQMIDVHEAVQEEQATLRRTAEELVKKTITDGLTGVFNRAHYTERVRALLTEAQATGQPLSLIFIDADKFKSVNDTHGHQTGDAVLIELAKRLSEAASRVGVVCRYGGEEFAILLPKIGLEKAGKVAELLRLSICNSVFDLTPHGVGMTLPITISLGVASAEGSNARWTPDQLTQAADEGVYAAKRGGRNRVHLIRTLGETSHAAAATPQAAPAATPQAAPAAGLRTLILDEDVLACEMISILLGKHAAIVPTVVHTAEAGLAATRGGTFDVIIASVKLQGMGGIDFVREFRAASPRFRGPCVLMATSVDDATRARAAAAGAQMLIPKMDLARGDARWLKAIIEAARIVSTRPSATAA